LAFPFQLRTGKIQSYLFEISQNAALINIPTLFYLAKSLGLNVLFHIKIDSGKLISKSRRTWPPCQNGTAQIPPPPPPPP